MTFSRSRRKRRSVGALPEAGLVASQRSMRARVLRRGVDPPRKLRNAFGLRPISRAACRSEIRDNSRSTAPRSTAMGSVGVDNVRPLIRNGETVQFVQLRVRYTANAKAGNRTLQGLVL